MGTMSRPALRALTDDEMRLGMGGDAMRDLDAWALQLKADRTSELADEALDRIRSLSRRMAGLLLASGLPAFIPDADGRGIVRVHPDGREEQVDGEAVGPDALRPH